MKPNDENAKPFRILIISGTNIIARELIRNQGC